MQTYTLNESELRAVQAKKCENQAQKALQQQKLLENPRKQPKKGLLEGKKGKNA